MFLQSDDSIFVAVVYTGADNVTQHFGGFGISSLSSFSTHYDASTNQFTLPIGTSTSWSTAFQPDAFLMSHVYDLTFSPIYAMDGVDGSYCLLAGLGGVTRLNIQPTHTFVSTTSAFSYAVTTSHFVSTTLYDLQIYPANPRIAMAVGDGIILSTNDGGHTWTDYRTDLSGVVLRSVFIVSETSAIATGDHGIILGNQGDGTWFSLDPYTNTNGMGAIIHQPSHMLTSVCMTSPDHFIVTSVYAPYTSSNTGQTKLFYCYWPTIFGLSNATVLQVDGPTILDGWVFIHENLTVHQNTRLSGTLSVQNDANFAHNLTCSGVLRATDLDDVGDGLIRIGYGSTAKTIYLSGGKSPNDPPNQIYVGGPGDSVIIDGSYVTYRGAIKAAKTIQLNSDISGSQTSAGAGLYIRDNNNDVAGFLVVDPSMDGFLFKAPSSQTNNVVQIQCNDLVSVTTKRDIMSGLPLSRGLLMVQPSTNSHSTVSVVSTPFDVHSVLLGNSAITPTTNGQQVISTDVGLYGITFVENPANLYALSSGAFQLAGGASITGNMYVGGNMISLNTTDSSSIGTGALVLAGGAGMGGNLHVGGNLTLTNVMRLTSQQNAYDVSSGALMVLGGASIQKNLHLGGALSAGSTYTTGNATVGGIVYLTNTINTPDATAMNTGVLQVNGGTSVDGNMVVGGNLLLQNPGTGALQVSGGAFVAKNMYLGQTLYLTSGMDASGVGTGTLQLQGGMSTTGNAYFQQSMFLVSGQDTNSTGTLGALQITGGASVQKSMYVGGNAMLNSTTEATGMYTGALQITHGGLSVYGNTYLGSNAIIGINNIVSAIPIPGNHAFEAEYSTLDVSGIGIVYYAGHYVGSASVSFTSAVFNGGTNTIVEQNWLGGNYSTSTGNYVSNNITQLPTSTVLTNGTVLYGEWLQIQLPYKFIVTQYQLLPYNIGQPTSWFLLGSNNGTQFDVIDQIFLNNEWYSNPHVYSTFQIALANMNTAYTYLRYVCTNTAFNNGTSYAVLQQWNLLGFPLSKKQTSTSYIVCQFPSAFGYRKHSRSFAGPFST